MPPKKKHSYTAVIFDANSSQEFKEEAIECYKKISGLKYLSGSLDETKLFLANAIDDEEPKTSFPATDYTFFNPSQNLELMRDAVGTQGNLLDCIDIAVDDLDECLRAVRYASYQLVIFSDLKTNHDLQAAKINVKIKRIVETLNKINGYVYFFGVNLEINALLQTKKCVYDFMESVVLDKSKVNLEIAGRIVKETYGVLCPFDLAVDLYFSYSFSKRGFPFLQPLDINGVEIPTSCVKYLDKKSLVRPKEDEIVPRDKMFVVADQQDEEVDFADVKSGLALHGKFVFIPPDVNKGLKNYPRFFKLLGFTDSKNVPPHLMLNGTNLVTVADGRDPGVGYVNYLIEAAEKYNKYGIALKSHMKGCRPKLFCLIPKTAPHYFIMKELPYAEDFQILYRETETTRIKTEKDAKVKSENIEEAVFDFLDSVNLDGRLKLHPFRRVSDSRKRQASLLTKKLLGEEIVHEDAGILGLRFDDAEILAKLEAASVSIQTGDATGAADDEDPW